MTEEAQAPAVRPVEAEAGAAAPVVRLVGVALAAAIGTALAVVVAARPAVAAALAAVAAVALGVHPAAGAVAHPAAVPELNPQTLSISRTRLLASRGRPSVRLYGLPSSNSVKTDFYLSNYLSNNGAVHPEACCQACRARDVLLSFKY